MIISTAAIARPLTTEEKLSDLDQLIFSIKSGYGPLQYKKDKYNIDVDKLRAGYAPMVAASKTNGEFYYLIRQFVAEFHDSHFSATIPTDKYYFLPFYVDLVEGKVLIDQVMRQVLPESVFAFKRGDEIVSMNNRPIGEEVEKLMPYQGMGFSDTSRRIATITLTLRGGVYYPAVKGPVTLGIRQAGSTEIKNVALQWMEQGEGLDEVMLLDFAPRKPRLDLKMLSIQPMIKNLLGPHMEASFMCSGGTRIKIPADATIIRQTPFVAYYHPTKKGNVGYLRIPHYYPVNEETGEDEAELRLQQYEAAVKVLEANTVGLVIDQDHNCGGRVDYLQALVSLFVTTEFPAVPFSLLATKQQYLEMSEQLKSLPEDSEEYLKFKSVVDVVKSDWLAGKFMTMPMSFDGVTSVSPNPVHYSKPIVILIDEMSGSGGDAFPALMGGIGRAKLIGTRTMGAGGHVADQPNLNYSQISYGMTKSLFYRPDGVPVENNGAVPHYPYTITRDDFVGGYLGYQSFYEGKLLELVK